MDFSALRGLDLTATEIRIYTSLLDMGPSTATKIAKAADMHRPKVYDSLERLQQKGLVHHTVRNYKKTFSANDAHAVLRLIEEKEDRLRQEKEAVQQLLPALLALQSGKKEEQTSNVYEGLKGIKIFHNTMLQQVEKGDELAVLGIPLIANELLEGYFAEFHQERIRRKVPARLLYSHQGKERVLARKRLALTQARYLSKEVNTPATVWLCKGTVGIFSFKPQPVCYEIRNKEIYEGFLSYFDILWKQGKG